MANALSPLNVSIGAALYAAPRLASHLSTPILKKSVFLTNLANYVFQIGNHRLGKKVLFILSDVIADNAWISFFVNNYLFQLRRNTPSGGETLEVVSCFVTMTYISWLARYGISRLFPATQGLIGPKNQNREE